MPTKRTVSVNVLAFRRAKSGRGGCTRYSIVWDGGRATTKSGLETGSWTKRPGWYEIDLDSRNTVTDVRPI